MWRVLVFPVCLEAAWLATLWLCLPETRPWGRRAPTDAPSAGRLRALGRNLLLGGYVLYHLPGIVVVGAFSLLDFRRMRPAGFLGLGAITAACYVVMPPFGW